ncbi:Thioredoxin domain protein OS=Tsukamurella paurometabola (strain ATCC 8368 / DSM / CCUG 35730/ CIP 100753 / JCM 10117 / KCTC 9821 / NBRC 16120 / NCIMB 702349 / NCTC 13040) OX=521096 GN=Tpau_1268 PE=4 SV=1 [Tsukamurella paurometabola]|nr:tetratricopeptide repeat protein [Tsukamurella paurometabola]SUP29261.1 thioredoxin 2 [Tsukamurella paurometabola]
MSGAVDLSGLKARAEAKATQQARSAAGAEPDGAPAGGGAVLDVTDQTFPAEVIDASARQLVVVALTASYSEQSAAMTAVLAQLAAQDGGRWKFVRVDVDAAPGVAQAFGAQSVPMVIAVAGGRAVTAFAGAQPESAVRQWLDDVLAQIGPALGGAEDAPAEAASDPRREAAEQLAADGDYAGAQAAYEAILHADPGDAEAAAAVKQMGFFARATAAEPGAVARADADPKDVDAALAAADEELLTGAPQAAFARLISAIRITAGDQRAALRTRLLELFELFDPSDAMVLAARRDLAAALF